MTQFPSSRLVWPATLFLNLAGLTLVASLPAAAAVKTEKVAGKRVISHDVYDSWRSIQGARLSRDGQWLVYALVAQDGDGQVVARNLKTGKEWRHPRGKDPVLSADGAHLAFAIAPAKADLDKAKKAKAKPEDLPKPGLGVMDLATGKVATLERVKAFRLAEDGGRYLAALLEPEKEAAKEEPAAAKDDEAVDQRRPAPAAKESGKKEAGTELVLWELASGARTSVPEVAEFVWSRDGNLLGYTVSVKEPKKAKEAKPESAKPGNPEAAREGAYIRDMTDGAVTTLLKGAGAYGGLAFDESGSQAGFLSSRDEAAAEAPAFKLYRWSKGAAQATEAVAAGTPGLPEGYAPSLFGKLEFSKDGQRLFLGTAPRPKAPVKGGAEVQVDIWSWKDPELQPMQKVRAEDERKLSFRAVLHLGSGRLVQLGSEQMPDLEINDNPQVALGYAPGAYRQMLSWDRAYADVYALDLETGARRLLASKLPWMPKLPGEPPRDNHLSPSGKYLYYFDREARAWSALATAGGPVLNLSAGAGVRFEREDDDHPTLPGPYGAAGWTAGDEALVVYDHYDLWALKPGGVPVNLTGGAGRKDRLEFRYLKLDPEEKALPATPWTLAATAEATRASGFYRLAGTEVRRLLFKDKQVGGLIKAKNAATVAFTEQRFDEFPDLSVSDLDLREPKKVTDANPQQREFVWGRSELIEYVNDDGRTLKAILTRPDNFDPSKKYPMMVYIYENMSNNLHTYQAPAPGTNINFSRFASQGYIILRPDIVYENGHPGESALRCVLPAVQKVLAMGFVDPARVGIQGHSWGGYQITYMVTRTRLFRCVEAGASVSDMFSAYGGIRWGTGMSRAFQYEHDQSRIGGTPWTMTREFLENSPLFGVERVSTPYLTIHNDDDDAVPWYQGIEFITALRRLGKEGWMFNYNGEKHGLRERANQKHWTVHLCEYFDHYLLGAPRPAWMDQPTPWLERGRRDTEVFYRRPDRKDGE